MATKTDDNRIRKVEYVVNENSPFSNADAQEYGQALTDICKDEEIDELTPALVLDRAAKTKSPLHRAFNWDDADAANKHRLAQARRILGAIKVQVSYVDLETQEVEVTTKRAFVHLAGEKGKPGAYHPVTKVLGDETMLKAAYEQFRTRANSFMATAKAFKDPEIVELVDELNKIVNRMNGRFRRR